MLNPKNQLNTDEQKRNTEGGLRLNSPGSMKLYLFNLLVAYEGGSRTSSAKRKEQKNIFDSCNS